MVALELEKGTPQIVGMEVNAPFAMELDHGNLSHLHPLGFH
jgi:hypothetical protein